MSNINVVLADDNERIRQNLQEIVSRECDMTLVGSASDGMDALSMNPEVLILDEPLAGLDENTQKMLIDFLKKFHVSGKTLIIITHNNQLAKELGTRFIRMNDKHEIII